VCARISPLGSFYAELDEDEIKEAIALANNQAIEHAEDRQHLAWQPDPIPLTRLPAPATSKLTHDRALWLWLNRHEKYTPIHNQDPEVIRGKISPGAARPPRHAQSSGNSPLTEVRMSALEETVKEMCAALFCGFVHASL
jgi:hypothetical protein